MSDSVPPHRRQPTRLPRPWDSPGKNTGVGCHLLLQCIKVKSKSEAAQSCPTLSYPMNCSLPGSNVHGILQARLLESVAIAFSQQKRLGSRYLELIKHSPRHDLNTQTLSQRINSQKGKNNMKRGCVFSDSANILK